MVMDILVPVSPSGTGNTLRSLMDCFCAVTTAAPWSTICLKRAPLICSFIGHFPPLQGHVIDADVDSSDFHAGISGHDIPHLVHNGAAHRREVDAVFHDDVELNGDGIILVVDDADALAHGLSAQQMHQTVRHGAVCHPLDAVEVCGGDDGDAGKDGAADGDIAQIGFKLNHGNVLSILVWFARGTD